MPSVSPDPPVCSHLLASPHCICCSDEALPGRIVAVLPGGMATVDFGNATREINIELIEAAQGDQILVHAGVAIARAAT